MIQIFHVGQQRKGRKTAKFIIFLKRRERNLHEFTKIRQNAGQKAQSKVTHPNFAPLGSSASIQKKKKKVDFRAFRIIFTILTALCHELNC